GMLLGDSSAAVRRLERLRAAGVRVAVDDFGTGYSSLSRLSELPIDTLKIDRSFISRLPNDRSGCTLVSTIISLARAFNMTVVAEGVETEEQIGALWSMGCDEAQGYLLSRPVPCDELAQLLAHGRARSTLPASRAKDPGGIHATGRRRQN
ncbi:MAG: EAL domain-containing protein, partial [Gammaproteobacteria bacterium]|nr:EAL domain-containing protein [Gammaproteobacteria bacterium]